jgi:hypothetical protein
MGVILHMARHKQHHKGLASHVAKFKKEKKHGGRKGMKRSHKR